MNICHTYGETWRYEFNHTKSGEMSGEFSVDELFEYKNLGVLKNYVSSFASNVDDDIEKARKKAGIILSSDFNRRKTNPLIYVKSWRQACLLPAI